MQSLNQIIINQIIILFILMAVGFYARKKMIMNDTLSKGLSNILINIALPALIISSFTFEFSKDMLKNAGLVIIFSIIIHIIIVLVSRIAFRKYDLDKKNVLNFLGVFPNAGFMGLPLIYAIYGQIGVFYASIFMVPYHILMWTYGQDIFIKSKKEAFSFKLILSKFKNPAIIGVAVGLVIFIFSVTLPYVIDTSLSMLGSVTSPLAMMIVGDKIAQIKFKDIFSDKDVYYGSFIRLIIAPLITFGILKGFHIDPSIINICVAVEAIPTAITIVILPQRYDGNTIFASKCALISHILSLITIPIMLILLNVS